MNEVENNNNMPRPVWNSGQTSIDSNTNAGGGAPNAPQNGGASGDKVVWPLIIGLLIGFGIGWLGSGSNAPSAEIVIEKMDDTKKVIEEQSVDVSTISEEDATRMVPDGSVILQIHTQPAGDQVLVNQVTTPRPSWVVVYEDRDGSLGNILGARPVAVGNTIDLRVELKRGTVANARYYIGLHHDNEDGFAFDFKDDEVLLLSSEGKPIFMEFMTEPLPDSPRG